MTRTLSDLLTTGVARTRDADWQPVLFDLSQEEGQRNLKTLCDRGAVAFFHDTLDEQLAELMETRAPAEKLPPAEVQLRIRRHLGATPLLAYGRWVYYPWSRRVVHVLPEAEFRELRTSRNRNKITESEQRVLRGLTLGIVGLSVGQSTAITLALEEVGGHFKLADFDRLALSNMNRLRTGVHNLGVNKAVMTAREIFEINPYARVSVFPDGVNEDTVDGFLRGEPSLSVLFDECDDLQMKVMLRERARHFRIPVLMESSDRGLIDVERFDLEPERPPFHGLCGDLKAHTLKGLSTYEKVPIVMKILGGPSISRRMAASLVDIESTLKTWPQLASGVTLGGALNTDVCRRVALGQFTQSGRFYVDLEDLVANREAPQQVATPDSNTDARDGGEGLWLAPQRHPPRSKAPTPHEVRQLVMYASMAPSGGNCQPWRFRFHKGSLQLIHDEERSRSFLDVGHHASWLALGAAAENLSLAALMMGWNAEIQPFPAPQDRHLAAEIRFHAGWEPTPIDAALAAAMPLRCTNRRRAPRQALSPRERSALLHTAHAAGAGLHLLTEPAALDEIGRILGQGDRLRFLSPVMHKEMFAELRFGAREALRSRDGIDVATLELTATEQAGMELSAHWQVMRALDEVGGGQGLEKLSRLSVEGASAVGVATFPATGPTAWFQGGRALQRVWLTAQSVGLALQPMSALLFLFLRLSLGGEGLSPSEIEQLQALRQRYRRLIPSEPDTSELLMFRLAHAGPPTSRSLRRAVEDILVFDG